MFKPSLHAQVLGHSKTICVLLGGWLFMGDVVSVRKLLGMVCAVAGEGGSGGEEGAARMRK